MDIFGKNRSHHTLSCRDISGIPDFGPSTYFQMLPIPVCASVCASVCLSVRAFYLNTIGPISMKLGPHDLNKNLRWDFSQILEMLPQWRHNGYFDVLRWGTLTPSIFVQFSSNWHMLLFNSLLCMGLQSSVFGSYLLSKMTVGKTVKNQSDVKLETNYQFW